jgi:hypothetical protein
MLDSAMSMQRACSELAAAVPHYPTATQPNFVESGGSLSDGRTSCPCGFESCFVCSENQAFGCPLSLMNCPHVSTRKSSPRLQSYRRLEPRLVTYHCFGEIAENDNNEKRNSRAGGESASGRNLVRSRVVINARRPKPPEEIPSYDRALSKGVHSRWRTATRTSAAMEAALLSFC